MQHALTLTFQGHIPSKKNSLRRFRAGNRTLTIPSKAHETWERQEIVSLSKVGAIAPPYYLIYKFWVGRLNSFDMSNSIESVQDVLVKTGILEDDSWRYLRGTSFELIGADFENPRCEVSIYRLERTCFDEALELLLDKAEFKAEAKRRRVSQKALDVELRGVLSA